MGSRAATGEVESDLAIPPGEFLAEELKQRRMSQLDLARRMGRPPQVISDIVRARKEITPETAIELETVLGMSAHLWSNLERRYRIVLARQSKQESVERDKQLLSEFPIKRMQDLGWLPEGRARSERVRMLRRYFAVVELDRVSATSVMTAFRSTGKRPAKQGSLAAWMRQGEIRAEQEELDSSFNASRFRATLAHARRLTTKPPMEAVGAIQRLWGESGVLLLLVPELPGVGVNGCTRWIASDRALVQINLRWRWADVFWFTLFHEAYHVLRRRRRKVYAVGFDDEDEADADRFACDRLIPADQWGAFVGSGGRFSHERVRRFSTRIGIAPGVVVGRLQHERLLDRSHLNGLRQRWEWVEK